MKLAIKPCPACNAGTVLVEDLDTGEQIRVDPTPVDEGHITVYSIKGHGFARRHGQPARLQPAWQEHACPAGLPSVTGRPEDPYADLPPAAQQHGGWRAS